MPESLILRQKERFFNPASLNGDSQKIERFWPSPVFLLDETAGLQIVYPPLLNSREPLYDFLFPNVNRTLWDEFPDLTVVFAHKVMPHFGEPDIAFGVQGQGVGMASGSGYFKFLHPLIGSRFGTG